MNRSAADRGVRGQLSDSAVFHQDVTRATFCVCVKLVLLKPFLAVGSHPHASFVLSLDQSLVLEALPIAFVAT